MLNQIRSRHMIDTHITEIEFVENSDTFFRDSIKKTQLFRFREWSQTKESLLARLVGGTMAIQDLPSEVSKSQIINVSRKTFLTFGL